MKCPSGKNRYDSHFLAETALIDIHIRRNFPAGQGPQDVYQCEFCEGWHFTSKAVTTNNRLLEMMQSGELRRLQQARQWE